MKKSKIMELIDSYYGAVNAEALLSHEPLQRGWGNWFFGTRTTGIEQLETFLQSNGVKDLASEDEIEGDNLLALLQILAERDKRIYKSYRSYENYPDRTTNRIYTRLYHLLLLDAAFEADLGVTFEHSDKLHQVLFHRINKMVLHQMEHNTSSDEVTLGCALILGETFDFAFNKEPQLTLDHRTSYTKVISHPSGCLTVEFNFIQGELYNATILQASIHYKTNPQAGLRWLRVSSEKGNKEASLQLAAFYARATPYERVNTSIDETKAWHFLSLARTQGLKSAAAILVKA